MTDDNAYRQEKFLNDPLMTHGLVYPLLECGWNLLVSNQWNMAKMMGIFFP